MPQFNLDDYEPVDSRLKRALEDHPTMKVNTELLTPMDQVPHMATFRAVVSWLDEGLELAYVGHAHEEVDKGFVNKTSHVENAETSAIGRALANAGYSGDKRPSREEMEKVERSSAYQNQKAGLAEKEAKARQKAKDMIADNREILGEDACIAYEVDLADAKDYDAVVTVGKELAAEIKMRTEGPPKTKKQKAEGMKQEEIF